MHIAISINQEYIKYAYVLLTSVCENHKNINEMIFFHVLYCDIQEEKLDVLKQLEKDYKCSVIFHQIQDQILTKQLPSIEKWPIEVWLRLALPFILPDDIERVLYLDTDTIVIGSLSELYATDFENCFFAACPDLSNNNLQDYQKELFNDRMRGQAFVYVNSGVLLMNIRKITEELVLDDFTSLAVSLNEKYQVFDQDLINYMFAGKIKFLDGQKYNHFARIGFLNGIKYHDITQRDTAIIHYTGPKPWSVTNLRSDVEIFWWEYARQTPFYEELLEQVLWGEMRKGYTETNEFRYQNLMVQQLEHENAQLQKMNDELLAGLNECRTFIEKHVQNLQ